MEHQTAKFANESLRYVKSSLDLDPSCNISLICESLSGEEQPRTILDVGCGNAANLLALTEKYCATGVGIEPSSEAIEILKEKYKKIESVKFVSGSAHALPFDTDSFDLVFVWSVLHWIGRNEYLQALGELIRVTKKSLVIMDFVAGVDYRVPYHHDKQFYTYKMDYEGIVLSSGIMEKLDTKIWWVPPENSNEEAIEVTELHPFLGNPRSYHSRKMVVFKKNYEVLPVHTAIDFNLVF